MMNFSLKRFIANHLNQMMISYSC